MNMLRCLGIAMLLALSGGGAGAAQIDMVSPAEGTIGTRITILGSGFGTGKPKVLLTGAGTGKAKVVQASDTQVVADVSKAKAGVYTVVVKGRGVDVSGAQSFTVRVPSNLAFDPPCPDPGTIVTMNGRFLGKKKGLVKVGGKKARVTRWSVDQMGDGSATLKLHKKTPRGQANVSIKTKVGTANVSQALGVGMSGQCTITPSTTSSTLGTTTTSTSLPAGTLEVVSAVADTGTSVIVTFSNAVDQATAEVAASYAITTSLLSPDSPTTGQVRLPITSAELVSSQTVRLTTCAMSSVKYNVKVGPVLDVLGRAIRAPYLGRTDPSSAPFVGTPGPTTTDADGDELTDIKECAGWIVETTRAAGKVRQEVNSDPNDDDTDDDGLGDRTENTNNLNPRDADTDSDELTDNQEFNEIYSDPANYDSDKHGDDPTPDGVSDGLEWNFFNTSPTLFDSDGDGDSDGYELNLGAARNPRLADLPRVEIEVEEMRVDVDVNFVETKGQQRTTVDSKTATAALTQSKSREGSRMNQSSHQYFAKVGMKTAIEAELSIDGGVKLNQEVSVEAGWTGNWMSQWEEKNRTEAVKSYSDSLTTEASLAQDATLSREYSKADLKAFVTIRNTGDLTFTVSNIEITALLPNPADPAGFEALATLKPAVGSDYTLAPGSTVQKVEFKATITSQSAEDIEHAESLVRNPRGVVFQVAYFDLTDQNKESFAWTTEDIQAATASVVIDYGGARSASDFRTENHRVATQVGRINPDGTKILREPNGRDAGITLRQALDSIGLEHYELTGTDRNTDEQNVDKRERSYSTFVDGHGVTRIWRIRNIERLPDKTAWAILTNNGIDQTKGIDDVILRGGASAADVKLVFLQDLDGDRLPATFEYANGCRDDDDDSDDDGLPDLFEVQGGWNVNVKGGPLNGLRKVFSQCNKKDTDDDGLEDAQELVGFFFACSNPFVPCACGAFPCPSDPSSTDTDADKLGDKNEQSKLTDLTDFDTDGDSPTVGDGREIELGGNPLVQDFNNFGDDDLDGVPNAVEDSCTYVVAYREVSPLTGCDGDCPEGAPGSDSPCPASFKNDADSEGGPGPGGDLVLDDEEYDHLLNPRDADSDHDGLTDRQELDGITLRADVGTDNAGKLVETSPLDADSDNDGMTDGDEFNQGWNVRRPDQSQYKVYTDPTDPDEDGDRLPDGLERSLQSDPHKTDTDGDTRTDYVEYLAGTDPTIPDLAVTLRFKGLSTRFTEEVNSATLDRGAADLIVDIGVKELSNGTITKVVNPRVAGTLSCNLQGCVVNVNWTPENLQYDTCVGTPVGTFPPIAAQDMGRCSTLNQLNDEFTEFLAVVQMVPASGVLPFSPARADVVVPLAPGECFSIVGEYSEWDGGYPLNQPNDNLPNDSLWKLDDGRSTLFLYPDDPNKKETHKPSSICYDALEPWRGPVTHPATIDDSRRVLYLEMRVD